MRDDAVLAQMEMMVQGCMEYIKGSAIAGGEGEIASVLVRHYVHDDLDHRHYIERPFHEAQERIAARRLSKT